MPTERTTFDWEPVAGQLLSFDVSYTVEPYRPAVINADPDQCRPEEGGMCDIEVELRQAEQVWFDCEATKQTWVRGFLNIGWVYDFAELAEAAVQRECEVQLYMACHEDAEATYERALADRDDDEHERQGDRAMENEQ